MKSLKLFVFGFMIYAFSRKKPQNETNQVVSDSGKPSPPAGGGSNGGGVVSPRGFTFQYNQQADQTDLYLVHLCSHARVCTQVSETPLNAIALLEYWLKDSDNNTVIYCKDEIGGHHPNFFDAGQMANVTPELRAKIETLKSSFVSNPPFYTYQDRTNNHFSTFDKQLKKGVYKWIVKNNGNTNLELFAGYAYSETENVQVNKHQLGAGGTVEFNLNIQQCGVQGYENSPFKINANNNP